MIWIRSLPGLVAAAGAAILLLSSRRKHEIRYAGLSTLLGLICMEAEYWIAHGFPWSEISFFTSAVLLTVVALALGEIGGAALGLLGLVFFAYVNLRYGAPYLLDYVQPVAYAFLLARSRERLQWQGSGVLRVGVTEGVWIIATYALTFWRTSELGKWGWMTGGPW